MNEQAWKEQAARIIDPASWAVMDSYLKQMLRKYKGQNIGYDPDAFKHKESMAIAEALWPLVQKAIAAQRGEPVSDKKTMTVTLTDAEINALEALSKEQELSPPRLLIQGLRLYQLHHERLKAGETVVWSGDNQRARDFAGPLATLTPTEAQIRADERERCAKVAENQTPVTSNHAAYTIATAIRVRGD